MIECGLWIVGGLLIVLSPVLWAIVAIALWDAYIHKRQ